MKNLFTLGPAASALDETITDEELTTSTLCRLSNRELEVFKLCGQGLTLKQLCAALDIQYKTAVTHRRRIMEKLNLSGDAQLGILYWRMLKHFLKAGNGVGFKELNKVD